jgi:ribosomal protein L37E
MATAGPRWSIRLAQPAPAGEVGEEGKEEVGEELPANFGTHLGITAVLNHTREAIIAQATQYGLDPASLENVLDATLNLIAEQNGIRKGSQAQLIIQTLPGGAEGVRFRNDGDVTTIFELLKERFNEVQCDQEQEIAIQYSPEPTGKGASEAWRTIPAQAKAAVAQRAEQMKATEAQPGVRPAWNLKRVRTAQGPLAVGRYESMSQLKDELAAMGPKPETYERIMFLVGPEKEDDAKDALGKFFQGVTAAGCALYQMLIDAGVASPIDAEVVEKVMANNPELADDKQGKAAGLYLPATDSGLYTTQGAKIEKLAASSYPAYLSHGPGENRMCPKIRQTVNTYICRNHCLDGLVVDDHQVLCGEAIWRQAVMDKFSREYRDANGNWVGGYLNKRFEIHRDDGGHPALLKPGTRHAPIHEDAWSTEKRLQEMRRAESKDRGYSETPGDPKDLYNFDQHDLAKGPKSPQLSEKKNDPIAKIAAIETDSLLADMAKTAGDPRFKGVEWAEPEPQEAGDEPPSKEDLEDANPTKKKGKEWPPKKTPFDGDEPGSKKKNSSSAWSIPKTANYTTVPEENSFTRDVTELDSYPLADGSTILLVFIKGEGYAVHHGAAADEGGLSFPIQHKQYATQEEAKAAFYEYVKKQTTKTTEAARYTKKVPEEKFKSCKEDVRENSPDLPEGSEYGICTKSLGGQPASYHKKKKEQSSVFNLRAAKLSKEAWGEDMMPGGGDNTGGSAIENVDHGPKGKKCKRCGKIFATMEKVCDACGSALADYTERDVQNATRFIEKPDIPAANGASVVFANGVFRASKAKLAGYGESAEEALFKLAQKFREEDLDKGLAKLDPPTVEEESDKMLGILEGDAQEKPFETQKPIIEEPTGDVVPEPQAMDAVEQVTPTTPEVPMDAAPPVPDEIEGGKTEFALMPEEGWHPEAETDIADEQMMEGMSDEQEDFFEPMMETTAAKKKRKPHVDAAELDRHLMDESVANPQATQEVEVQCQNLGA